MENDYMSVDFIQFITMSLSIPGFQTVVKIITDISDIFRYPKIPGFQITVKILKCYSRFRAMYLLFWGW